MDLRTEEKVSQLRHLLAVHIELAALDGESVGTSCTSNTSQQGTMIFTIFLQLTTVIVACSILYQVHLSNKSGLSRCRASVLLSIFSACLVITACYYSVVFVENGHFTWFGPLKMIWNKKELHDNGDGDGALAEETPRTNSTNNKTWSELHSKVLAKLEKEMPGLLIGIDFGPIINSSLLALCFLCPLLLSLPVSSPLCPSCSRSVLASSVSLCRLLCPPLSAFLSLFPVSSLALYPSLKCTVIGPGGVRWSSRSQSYSIDTKCAASAGAIDTDGSGSINKQELGAAITRLNKKADAHEVQSLIAELMNAGDADGDGTIDRSEFIELLLRYRPRERRVYLETVAALFLLLFLVGGAFLLGVGQSSEGLQAEGDVAGNPFSMMTARCASD